MTKLVMITTPPVGRTPRRTIHNDAEAIQVWNNTGNRDHHPFTSVQARGIGNGPAREKMSDRAHADLFSAFTKCNDAARIGRVSEFSFLHLIAPARNACIPNEFIFVD